MYEVGGDCWHGCVQAVSALLLRRRAVGMRGILCEHVYEWILCIYIDGRDAHVPPRLSDKPCPSAWAPVYQAEDPHPSSPSMSPSGDLLSPGPALSLGSCSLLRETGNIQTLLTAP